MGVLGFDFAKCIVGCPPPSWGLGTTSAKCCKDPMLPNDSACHHCGHIGVKSDSRAHMLNGSSSS